MCYAVEINYFITRSFEMFPLVRKCRSGAKRVDVQVIFEHMVTPSECAKLLTSLMEYLLIQLQQLPGCPRTFYVQDPSDPNTEDQICSIFTNGEHSRNELRKLLNDFNTLKQSLQEEMEDGNITDLELHIGSGPPFTDHLVHVSIPPLSEETDDAPKFLSKHMALLFKKICECEDLQKAVDDVVRPSNVDVFFAKHSHAVSRNFYPVKHFVDCASKSHINIEFLVHPTVLPSCSQPEYLLSSTAQNKQVSWYRMQGIRGFSMAHLFS